MTDLNQLPLEALYAHLTSGGLVRRLLVLARDEDLGAGGRGDITSEVTVPSSATASAAFIAREAGTAAGLAAIPELLAVFGAAAELSSQLQDGKRFAKGQTLATIRGSKRDLLAIERTALNLLSRLCGIATLTGHYLAAAGGTARLYDTRKTTPGLRVLEKYAVRCGGGWCHRMGLHDAVLIKDNHLAGIPPEQLGRVIAQSAAEARRCDPPPSFIEVEVDSLRQLAELLRLAPGTIDIVLLDNMPPELLKEAVAMRNSEAPGVQLEASGGVRLETIRAIAGSGVDRISVGALTHSAVAIDIGLDFDASGSGAPV